MKPHSDKFRSVGQTYGNFVVTKIVEIPELQCTLRELVHTPTQALVMHIANEDPENLFCLSFQTLPYNSNGVAHILEHTVLCGSKKYPVKDPFFAMTRRSLNTFMNAFTGSDFTCYPAASQVPQDFYNLLDVYLDAVFHPDLKNLSFLQEGHRLEFTTPTDPSTPLLFKGIVFNEMKGALSSPNARLTEAMNAALFPNLPYGYDSGGNPQEIPSLKYQELIDFHKKFYHPSRCLFYFYGNMPLERHLDFIEENALAEFKSVPQLPSIPSQPRFTHPVYQQHSYPITSEEETKDKTLISFGWLMCHILEQQELLALDVLAVILMDNDASPLKMALLKSGLCKQASAYINEDISEIPLVLTLKGCNPESADQLEALIQDTIGNIIKNGIPLDVFENAVHQLEIYRSEITGNGMPFGLSLFMRSALLKQHGGKPEDGLIIHSLFEALRRQNLENPHYLTGLLKKHILDNPHRARIVMVPDQKLGAKELDEEKELLNKIRNQLTKDEINKIVEQTEELAKFQKDQEEIDLDILPKLELKDVPKHARYYDHLRERLGKLEVFSHHCFTNDILYADLIFDLPKITKEDLPYISLFCTLLSQVGCGGRDYQQNLEYIQANTGGIGATLSLNLNIDDKIPFTPSLSIRGKAIHRKTKKLFQLLQDIVVSLDFSDISRLKEVILKQYTGLESSLNQNALKYAINLSASQVDVASMIANECYGLNYFWTVKNLAQNFDENAENLRLKLEQLKHQLLGLDHPYLVLTCDAALYNELKTQEFYGLQNIATKSFTPWENNFSIQKVRDQGRIISSPIAFIAKVFKTVPYSHPDSPALNIAACLLDNLTLHPLIREQGGAYGGGASSNAMSANFYFYSYRDPNIVNTLQAFESSIHNLVDGKFDEEDLIEAKLEMIQSMDTPVSPGSRGLVSYNWWREGKTPEIRQTYRNKLLGLTKAEVIQAVARHIAPHFNDGATIVFAGKDLLEKENEVLIKQNKPLIIESIENNHK